MLPVLRQSDRMSGSREIVRRGLEEDVESGWIPESRIASVDGDMCGQEPVQTFILEKAFDSSAVPGAERVLGDDHGSIITLAEESDHHSTRAAADEVVKFSCKESECQWYCQHHDHHTRTEDFSCDADRFLSNAEKGCPGCTLWKDIAATRCACRLADSELRSDFPEPHPPKLLDVTFVTPAGLPVVEITWSCGPTKLEIATPPGTYREW